jgi:hypothetical protein
MSGRPEFRQGIARGIVLSKFIINMVLAMPSWVLPHGVTQFGIDLDKNMELCSIIEHMSVYWNSGWQAA